ncbi:cell division protein FtsQ [Pseudidiomarina planktonica]|uniref:Cell division protein FtsQ n=1 Tax=Pseudidiomarina planktonica TaxID=1323738 RepID=A0A1Y6EHY2_9GAMM|nr:cell division protein FtsQ/DivIB [Pseudidiomarina planktonica]RUO66058.1 cell division protein DivIVA [Pseudidiomarina planktonica]SMQ60781.1 cell division protein FtsQ [Pseudidiomarina planktonica]
MQSRWQLWGGVTFLALVLIITSGGSWWLQQQLMDANQMPLRRLLVQGELQQVAATEVQQALRSQPLGSFFSADVDELRQRVEALAWVDRASVRKEWPDLLRVYVVEQQPIAYWNDNLLMNERGELFSADVEGLAAGIPYLYGPPDAATETLSTYQRLSALLELNGFVVRALRLSERFAAELVLEGGTEIRLGREARLQRIQRFIDLYPAIEKQQQGAIDYVDLRYDTGVAVRWREPEQTQQDES